MAHRQTTCLTPYDRPSANVKLTGCVTPWRILFLEPFTLTLTPAGLATSSITACFSNHRLVCPAYTMPAKIVRPVLRPVITTQQFSLAVILIASLRGRCCTTTGVFAGCFALLSALALVVVTRCLV